MSVRDKWEYGDSRRAELRRGANGVALREPFQLIDKSTRNTATGSTLTTRHASDTCPRCGGFVGGRWAEDTSCLNCGWVPSTQSDAEFDFMAALLEEINLPGHRTFGPRDL